VQHYADEAADSCDICAADAAGDYPVITPSRDTTTSDTTTTTTTTTATAAAAAAGAGGGGDDDAQLNADTEPSSQLNVERSISVESLPGSASEMDMGWVHPCVGLGWVGLGWVKKNGPTSISGQHSTGRGHANLLI